LTAICHHVCTGCRAARVKATGHSGARLTASKHGGSTCAALGVSTRTAASERSVARRAGWSDDGDPAIDSAGGMHDVGGAVEAAGAQSGCRIAVAHHPQADGGHCQPG